MARKHHTTKTRSDMDTETADRIGAVAKQHSKKLRLTQTTWPFSKRVRLLAKPLRQVCSAPLRAHEGRDSQVRQNHHGTGRTQQDENIVERDRWSTASTKRWSPSEGCKSGHVGCVTRRVANTTTCIALHKDLSANLKQPTPSTDAELRISCGIRQRPKLLTDPQKNRELHDSEFGA